MKIAPFAFLAALFLSAGAQAIKPVAITVVQPDSPVLIRSYEAHYSRGSSSGVVRVPEGINHELVYENETDRRIVGVKFGLVSFSLFNEFIGKMGGISTETLAPDGISKGKETYRETGKWIQRRRGSFAFFTGVAYVSKVRFEDGEVWSADLETVMEELEKIEEGFDEARLTEEEELE
jgi:hypothetical protein